MLLYVLSFSNKKKLITYFSIFIFIIQLINSNNITINSKKTRKKDNYYGNIIKNEILKYEKENNIKINTIEYCTDKNTNYIYKNIRETREPTTRGFSGEWVFENTFNYYIPNHNFKVIKNQKIHKTIFNSKEWDEFSFEQIKFDKEKVYFCIY